MYLVYIDDSRDEKLCVFSALAIPAEQWRVTFGMVKAFRHELRRNDGIYERAELHAWKLVKGKGNIADRVVTKWRRCQIFRETLELVARLPGALLFNAVFPKAADETAFEWLLNRINVAMTKADDYAILLCDEGKEAAYTRIARRMGVYNPIPSMRGQWESTGTLTKNIRIDRILEDPIFKQSDRSYFIQLADICAFALLRRERPTEGIKQYGLESAFSLLNPVLVIQANHRDPEGIIRPWRR